MLIIGTSRDGKMYLFIQSAKSPRLPRGEICLPKMFVYYVYLEPVQNNLFRKCTSANFLYCIYNHINMIVKCYSILVSVYSIYIYIYVYIIRTKVYHPENLNLKKNAILSYDNVYKITNVNITICDKII